MGGQHAPLCAVSLVGQCPWRVSMPGSESPIFARTYDLLRWLIPLTIKFPRQQRFVLAEALQGCALRLHE
jgi:hypothetical protein